MDYPWFTSKLRLEKEEAVRSGDRDSKEVKYRFSREVRGAKLLYSERLQQQFSGSDLASVEGACEAHQPQLTNPTLLMTSNWPIASITDLSL